MKQSIGFVVVLINEGKEVGAPPQIYSTGCYVEIVDWESLANGLLGISIEAKHRVKLTNSSVRDDGLLLADTSPFETDLDTSFVLQKSFEPLVSTLQQLLQHPFAQRYKDKIDFNNAAQICYRLSELLPISNKHKQLLLETETAEQMLDQLAVFINSLQK